MLRRAFLFLPASLVLARAAADIKLDVNSIDRQRILKAADRYLRESPVTSYRNDSPRSAGGKHDFFSEGDYWWPDPQAPNGPYIQRDGMTQSRQLRRASARADAPESCTSGAGWRLDAHARATYAAHAARISGPGSSTKRHG